jgi:pyruvate kinase
MARQTKIIATLGPSTDKPGVLAAMLQEGLDMVRLNFSHQDAASQEKRVKKVRRLSKALNKEIGVIGDLQGAKVRIGCFEKGFVQLVAGKRFSLDCSGKATLGNVDGVAMPYKGLLEDVYPGKILLLNDGLIRFCVVEILGEKIVCDIQVGGVLADHKGINLLGGGLSICAITEKDREDIKGAVRLGVDYLAVSFPKCADDMLLVRRLVREAGGDIALIAKIERKEALVELEDIIEASDAVMVARGDLAVEIGDAQVPVAQKKIIKQSRLATKPVITATQMMESMIEQAVPTRAEVSDVANAVLDGTDAVMLSAETAVGHNPVAVIQAIGRACRGVEKSNEMYGGIRSFFSHEVTRIDRAIALATVYAADQLKIKAIIALTESGATVAAMSQVRLGVPIYALSRQCMTRRRLSLFRDVFPVLFDVMKHDMDMIEAVAAERLHELGLVASGDLIAVTRGSHKGVCSGTNNLKIIEVGGE